MFLVNWLNHLGIRASRRKTQAHAHKIHSLSHHQPRSRWIESLEKRACPANLQLTGTTILNTAPVHGEQIYGQANYNATALAANASYDIEYKLDGVPLLLNRTSGAGLASSFWVWIYGGWIAAPGTHTLEITLDKNNAIAETDESDNTGTFTFSTVAPTTLPQKLLWPLAPSQANQFGVVNYIDNDPRSGTQFDYVDGPYVYDGHNGIDITVGNFPQMDAGLPLYASAAGTVTAVVDGNYDREITGNSNPANFVEIDHGNGWKTQYLHIFANSITVTVGQQVTAGQLIGMVGSSGSSTDAHLHYMVIHNGFLVEPYHDISGYFAPPVPVYEGDQAPHTLAYGVSNYNVFADLKEGPSSHPVFSTSQSSSAWFWYFMSHVSTNDIMKVQWYRPDGGLQTENTSVATGVGRHAGYGWFISSSIWSQAIGTWQVVLTLNGSELARSSFQVVSSVGQPEILLRDSGSRLIPDGRTTPVDFGSVAQGGTAPTQTYTIQNHGATTLLVNSIVAPPGFSVAGAVPSSVAAGGSATFAIQLDTTVVGAKFGAVRVNTNDSDESTYDFNVKGAITGTAPAGIPTINLPDPAASYRPGQQFMIIAPNATFTDSDSTQFGGGQVTIEFASGGRSGDRLTLRSQGTGVGQIAVSGSNVFYGGVSIGSYTAGTDTAPLTVVFNTTASQAAIQALLRTAAYSNFSAPSAAPRYVRFTVTDETGKISNQPVETAVPDVIPPANVLPTISNVADQNTNRNNSINAIPFTIGDQESAASALTVSASSSNTTVIPNANLTVTGTGASRSLAIVPATNQIGTSTITVTVTDETGASSSDTFVITVNSLPTISDISSQTIFRNTSTNSLAFTVGDVETATASLVVSASSSNVTLVPNSRIIFAGSGASRTVVVTPAADRSGTATITVTVADANGGSTSDTFLLTVDIPANTLPTISDLVDQTVQRGNSVGPLSFSVQDAESTVGSLTVTARSSNTILVPNGAFTLGGSGANRTLTVQTAANQIGTATITVTVTDPDGGQASDTFVLTVNPPPNVLPTISDVGNITVTEDSVSDSIPFSVGDVETSSNLLTVIGSSSNPNLVSAAGITISGTGSSRSVRISPVSNQFGSAVVTLSVTDADGGTAADSFTVSVSPINDLPILSTIPNLRIDEDSDATIAFSASDIETPSNGLLYAVASTNITLIAPSNVIFGDSGVSRTLRIRPSLNQFGTAMLTVSATDADGAAVTRSFVVTVSGVNDTPQVSAVNDIAVFEGTSISPIPFTIFDAETVASSLNLTVSSSNAAIVPISGLQITGTGTSRNLIITPRPNATGTAVISISARDPLGQIATSSFNLAVNFDPQRPRLSDIEATTIPEDTTSAPISFTISDQQTVAADLVVSASSSNAALIPNSQILISGTGASRQLQLTPMPNQSGTSVITVVVTDRDGNSRQDAFELTVTPVNDLPTISTIEDLTLPESTSRSITFNIGDIETSPENLTLSVASSNATLLPSTRIAIGGTGTNRTLTVSPPVGLSGEANITVTLTDANGGRTTEDFRVVVTSVNSLPSISTVASQTISEDRVFTASFFVGDTETPASDLVVSATSSNESLAPATGIQISGTAGNRTVSVTPEPDQAGSTLITLLVSDSEGATTETSFMLAVRPVNDSPIIQAIPAQLTLEDVTLGPFALELGDPDSLVDSLVLTATSSNTAIVQNSGIVISGSGDRRMIVISPVADRSGETTITLVVRDDQQATATTSFLVCVDPVNDSDPVAIDDQISVLTGGVSAPLQLKANDRDEDLPNDNLAIDPELVTQPEFGAVSVDPFGAIRYQHAGGRSTTDMFQYRIRDAAGHTAVGTVRIIITSLPLSADAGGPYAIDPGQILQLDASQTSAVNRDGVMYQWDLNNDAVFDVISADAMTDVSWSRLADLGIQPGERSVRLRVATSSHEISEDTARLTISSDFEFHPQSDGTAGEYLVEQVGPSFQIRRTSSNVALTPPGLVGLTNVTIVGSNDSETFIVGALSQTLRLEISGNSGFDRVVFPGSIANDVVLIGNSVGIEGVEITGGVLGQQSRTVVSVDELVVNGGSGNDLIDASRVTTGVSSLRLVLNGDDGSDRILGGAGDDAISGAGGDDTIFGGPGNDYVRGGAGLDSLSGDAGDDTIFGQGSSRDTLSGGLGNDLLDGGAGDDYLIESGNVNFTLTDTRLTGLGTDRLVDLELPQLFGGSGQNTLTARDWTRGGVQLSGGGGNDVLIGSAGNDVLNGSSGLDSLLGLGGNDRLYGGSDEDLLEGSEGDDSLLGGLGDDRLLGGVGNDTLNGGSGHDTLEGGDGNDGLSGYTGDDILAGGSGLDTLVGGVGNDSLTGGIGDDIVLGKAGADTVDGGDGNDTLAGGSGLAADLGDVLIGLVTEINEAFRFTAGWIDAI